MSRSLKSMLTCFTVRLNNVSSAFALHFWQPLPACYGQVISGNDEILFPLDRLIISDPQALTRH